MSKNFTPAILYLIIPGQVPYAQSNYYEAALSWKDKEKIKGLYVVSPFYKETDENIIAQFKSLGVDLPAVEEKFAWDACFTTYAEEIPLTKMIEAHGVFNPSHHTSEFKDEIKELLDMQKKLNNMYPIMDALDDSSEKKVLKIEEKN